MQADCQEMVARRTECNRTPTAPWQTSSASQPSTPNTPAARSQKLRDTKRIALKGNEINESIGIPNSGETSVRSAGTGIESKLNVMSLDAPPLIASHDMFGHPSDDFLAVHSDYSFRPSLF